MMVLRLASILLVSAFAALGCFGGGAKVSDSQGVQSKIESAQEISELNSKLIAQGTSSAPTPADYLIGPADLLEIRVFESEKLTALARVSSRGEITLPLLENVDVNGLTARELEIKIEERLNEGGYINDPHVSVFIKEHNSKLVSVVGNVAAPGSYEILGKETILGVLARAKGLTDRAGKSVYLTRMSGNEKRESYVINLDDLLLDDNPGVNLNVEPGDVIYVPEAGSIFVEGAVGRPGSYTIKDGSSTVSQSITSAGGLASFANSGDIKLVRYIGNGKREVTELDLKKIQNGEAEDPVVKDRDAIIVGVNPVRKLLSGLRLTYLWGLLGIGYDNPDVIYAQ